MVRAVGRARDRDHPQVADDPHGEVDLARIKRSTWLNVNADAKPRSFSDNQLTLAFASQGNALGFQRGQHTDNLKQAISKVLGLGVRPNTQLAKEAGLPLASYPHVMAWLERVRSQPGFLPTMHPYSVDPHSGRDLP